MFDLQIYVQYINFNILMVKYIIQINWSVLLERWKYGRLINF